MSGKIQKNTGPEKKPPVKTSARKLLEQRNLRDRNRPEFKYLTDNLLVKMSGSEEVLSKVVKGAIYRCFSGILLEPFLLIGPKTGRQWARTRKEQ